MNSWEMRHYEVVTLMADIEINAITAKSLHFVVNGTGNYVPWCELSALVEVWHDAVSIREN